MKNTEDRTAVAVVCYSKIAQTAQGQNNKTVARGEAAAARVTLELCDVNLGLLSQ